MRKKAPAPLNYFLLFSLPVVALVFLLSLELRDRKLEEAGDRIRNLQELVTARQIYRNVIYTEVRENLIVDKRSLFTINYIVTAGVDLSSGFSLKAEENRIVVSYSSPRIFSIDADESSIDEYFALERFGRIKQSDYLDTVYDEKERIRKEAVDSELLERADRNLQSLITGILRDRGITDIRFEHSGKGEGDEV
ncbi:MAG: DUF4230 domain-containing protein [Spirochaetales bacterium]|nr:DUF4230 domain-containing protein [Spirochaetales bacterium]